MVRRQEFRYDTLGQVGLATQYDATTSGNVTSQVQREYNGFGQLTVEYQAIGGAVDLGNTPKVQYDYSEAANGTNHSRLESMTYPDGRELDYVYGSANGTDDRISRLTAITDSSGALEAYGYLGLATVVVRSHPQPGIDLSYVLRTPEAFGDAGDPYNGLDRFGRVVDQRWVDSGNGTAVDRFQYGYDRNSNRLWRDNLNNATFGEIYAYDDLGQLVAFDRGTLNGNHTGLTGNATRSQSWDLDPLGNWNGVTTDGTTEAREHNAQNEVTDVGNATLAFDAAGNMLTDEQGQRYTYDAWNRLVEVQDSGNATIAEYGYDALRRRTEETHGNATTELYYSAGWQVLEERDAATGNTTMEYTWSPVYVDALIERDRDSDGDGGLDERLWVQQDANWNVTSVVDGSGTVVERYAYNAYGARTVLDAGWGADGDGESDVDFKQGFQGMFFDETSGTYKSRGRTDFDPGLGRTFQSDPLGLRPDVNSYRWEYGNPLVHTDPSGLDVWVEMASGNEPIGHLSISVGDPNGEYISYSFGVAEVGITSSGSLYGMVYQDTETGGAFYEDYYLKTKPEIDAKIKKLFDEMVASKNRIKYNPSQTCRNFSRDQFKSIEEALQLPRSKPPERQSKPLNPLRPIILSTATTTISGAAVSGSKPAIVTVTTGTTSAGTTTTQQK